MENSERNFPFKSSSPQLQIALKSEIFDEIFFSFFYSFRISLKLQENTFLGGFLHTFGLPPKKTGFCLEFGFFLESSSCVVKLVLPCF